MTDIALPEDCLEDLHDERLQRLLAYWRAHCGGADMPAKAAIDPLDFAYVLGYVTLVDVEKRQPGPRRYHFRLDGSILAELSGVDYTGKYLDELGMPAYSDFIAAGYNRVADGGKPYAYRKAADFDAKSFAEESLILPLGQNGVVERLMVAVIPGDLPLDYEKRVI